MKNSMRASILCFILIQAVSAFCWAQQRCDRILSPQSIEERLHSLAKLYLKMQMTGESSERNYFNSELFQTLSASPGSFEKFQNLVSAENSKISTTQMNKKERIAQTQIDKMNESLEKLRLYDPREILTLTQGYGRISPSGNFMWAMGKAIINFKTHEVHEFKGYEIQFNDDKETYTEWTRDKGFKHLVFDGVVKSLENNLPVGLTIKVENAYPEVVLSKERSLVIKGDSTSIQNLKTGRIVRLSDKRIGNTTFSDDARYVIFEEKDPDYSSRLVMANTKNGKRIFVFDQEQTQQEASFLNKDYALFSHGVKNSREKILFLVKIKTGEIILNAGSPVSKTFISPDAQLVYFVDNNGSVFTLNLQTRQIQNSGLPFIMEHFPVLSPAGNFLAYIRRDNEFIEIYDLKKRKVIRKIDPSDLVEKYGEKLEIARMVFLDEGRGLLIQHKNKQLMLYDSFLNRVEARLSTGALWNVNPASGLLIILNSQASESHVYKLKRDPLDPKSK